MKKGLIYLLAPLFFAGLITLQSCGGDDVPPVLVVTSLSDGFDASTDTFTGNPGDTLVLDISVDAEDVFKSLSISKSDGSSLLSEERTEDKQTTFTTSFNYVLTEAEVGQDVSLTITATDDNDMTDDVTIAIVTNKAPTPVKSYNVILLAAPLGDETGQSFFTTDGEGKTYSHGEITSTSDPISATIDLCYRYGNSDGAVLSAPSAWISAIYDGLSAWGTKNSTLLKKTSMEASHFDMIKNNDDLNTHWVMAETGDADGDVLGLAVNDIVTIELDAARGGAKGFIRVKSIVEGFDANGKIELELLMEGAE